MKFIIFLLLIPALLSSCKDTGNKPVDEPAAARPRTASKNSAAFNQSFQVLLSTYYALKDAILDADTLKANTASMQLAKYADSLPLSEIGNDSTSDIQQTARNYAGTINGSALGLAKETDLTQKKKEFQMISDAMYDLVRTVKYDQEVVYHQHCPMAFNDNEEAYWLSNKNTIENPYLGRKHPKYRNAMLACGDITDSLDFSK